MKFEIRFVRCAPWHIASQGFRLIVARGGDEHSFQPRVVGRLGIAGWWIGAAAVLFLTLAPVSRGDESGWKVIPENLDSFRDPKDQWSVCGDVKLDPANRRKLVTKSGQGIVLSYGRGVNLCTKETYRDCEVELEFMIPQGSNSGVKLAGCYEVQIFDSWKKKKVTGSDCGGIYPRAELKPQYHTLDDGIPPKENACRAPGQWQTLKIAFRSPRFDESGKKVANAKFDRVELNGVVIHENQEVAYPTGHAWHDKEHDKGPLLLQGDHGPVAFRNLRLRPM